MNKARGEILVELGDLSFVACATMGAVVRIEGRLGMSIPQVVTEKVAESSYTACLAILEETCMDEDARPQIANCTASPAWMIRTCVDILKAGQLMDNNAGGGKGGKKQKGQG